MKMKKNGKMQNGGGVKKMGKMQDEFEEELQAIIPEPDNPDYEQRKAADAGVADTGIQSEDTDPL